MSDFERPAPTEAADIGEIVRGILALQRRFATDEHRPLARGTHAKGLCVRGVFEVFDVATTTGDPALAGRLARGPFARPGRYPAVVRFANAESRVRSDTAKDVRALSFSVTYPGEAGADGERRVDFSMNDSPTFPIDTAHDFAVLMRVLAAPGRLGSLRAFLRLPLKDKLSLLRTGVRGGPQRRRAKRAYQCMRYWSTVPFAHGEDEVIKYSAIPAPENPAAPLRGGPDELRLELLRHLADDGRMSRFDFAVQLLEPAAMRHRGRRKEASFWVESAATEWSESEAPFYRVGRLTLLPASQLSAAECEAQYIDVTEHRFPENRPLGSINRARWAAEKASREARLPESSEGGGPPAGPAPRRSRVPFVTGALRLGRRLGAVPVRRVARAVVLGALAVFLLVSGVSLATMLWLDSGRAMLPAQPTAGVLYPDQGWGAGVEAPGRQTYYYTSQGAGLRGMRYSWFVNLEMPWGKERFASPEVMRRYGFLVDPGTPANPDALPVGFTRHFDRTLNEEVLSITCAACHTGELHYTKDGVTTAYRVDGGQALHAFTDASFGHFLPTMLGAMVATVTNPFKFNRFARRVLGDHYPEGKSELKKEMRAVIGTFGRIAWNERKLYPTQEGYGRTDALARIANTVFGENLERGNLDVGNAPVSYPPVWNIWKFDWVQYNASVSQPMARNIGEALGVGAAYALVNRYGLPLPEEERFRSTALVENLHTIETTLWELEPPSWPEELFGPVDTALAAQGRELFTRHCAGCHGPHVAPPDVKARNAPGKGPDDPEWVMKLLCVEDIGTDPNAAVNFAHAVVDISATGMTASDLRTVALENLRLQAAREDRYLAQAEEGIRAQLASMGEGSARRSELQAQLDRVTRERAGVGNRIEQRISSLDPARIPVGLALSYLGTMIREKAYLDMGIPVARQDTLNGYGIADVPQVVAGYKPRPLAGIWATPPFLHNGSVPTVYDLLSPVADRPTEFAMGSREYDPERLGLKQPTGGRWFTFDTSLPGNRNTGHEFGEAYVPWTPGSPPQGGLIGPALTPDERMAIIEHLKVRDDDAEAVQMTAEEPPASCPVPARILDRIAGRTP